MPAWTAPCLFYGRCAQLACSPVIRGNPPPLPSRGSFPSKLSSRHRHGSLIFPLPEAGVASCCSTIPGRLFFSCLPLLDLVFFLFSGLSPLRDFSAQDLLDFDPPAIISEAGDFFYNTSNSLQASGVPFSFQLWLPMPPDDESTADDPVLRQRSRCPRYEPFFSVRFCLLLSSSTQRPALVRARLA